MKCTEPNADILLNVKYVRNSPLRLLPESLSVRYVISKIHSYCATNAHCARLNAVVTVRRRQKTVEFCASGCRELSMGYIWPAVVCVCVCVRVWCVCVCGVCVLCVCVCGVCVCVCGVFCVCV